MTRADRRLVQSGSRRTVVAMVVGGVVVLSLPVLLGRSTYALDLATVALVYALFAVSWDLFCGTTGELSFGHTFPIGAAAFATALLQSHAGLPPSLALCGGAIAGAFAGGLIGLLTLRHTGAVFTMVTMAAQLTFYRTLFIWSDTFGGEEGVLVTAAWIESPLGQYCVIAVLAVGGLVASVAVRESRLGRELRASGGDTRVGLACGVRVGAVRTWGCVVSGFIAGVGGAALVMHHRLANHELAGDSLAGLIFLLAIVGGFNTIFGPWIAALLYVAFFRETLVPLGALEPTVLFGTLLVVVWAYPTGVAGWWRAMRRTVGARGR